METKTVAKQAWRMAVRDKKNWERWQFSKEYDTVDELYQASRAWIESNPGRVIQFQSRTYWVAK